jgi:heme/copper-type cytochrome/quinol oxidase subunit 3
MTTSEPTWTHDHTRPTGWWGMLLGVATEATLFATLIASYFYLRFKNVDWPPAGIDPPRVLLPCLFTALLLVSAAALFLAGRSIVRGRLAAARAAAAAALLATLAYLPVQFLLLRDDWGSFRPSGSAYASIYYTVTGALWAHAAAGALLFAFVLFQVSSSAYRPVWSSAVQVAALYGYFLGGTAVFVLVAVYLSPQL